MEKDSTSTKVLTAMLKLARFQPVCIILFLTACTPDLSDDPIPPVIFEDIVLTLSLPENTTLNTDGGYRDLSQAYPASGVRGIIVYRKNASTYLAFERNCSFQPNSACATVDVHNSTLFLQDACCGSTFTWDGNPSGGPAWRPLRQYATILNGNQLTITDESLN